MRKYYIHTKATEDKPEMTCCYAYRQWCEMVAYFKSIGRQFTAWSEYEEEGCYNEE